MPRQDCLRSHNAPMWKLKVPTYLEGFGCCHSRTRAVERATSICSISPLLPPLGLALSDVVQGPLHNIFPYLSWYAMQPLEGLSIRRIRSRISNALRRVLFGVALPSRCDVHFPRLSANQNRLKLRSELPHINMDDDFQKDSPKNQQIQFIYPVLLIVQSCRDE